MKYIWTGVTFLILGWSTAIDLFPGENWSSGFMEASDSSKLLHYMLFKCRDQTIEKPPLLVWFSGGPGYSSMFGVYADGGPYLIDKNTGNIVYNDYAWNNIADTLFVDQPAGTLFSIAKDLDRMCKTISCVAEDFLAFLLNFYTVYPEYRYRDLYISGSSYGGHYVPSIAYHLLRQGKTKIPLKGFITINGYYDYYLQAAGNLYFLLINNMMSKLIYSVFTGAVYLCRLAELYNIPILPLVCSQSDMLVYMLMGYDKDPYDIERPSEADPFEKYLVPYLNQPAVQQALGVNQKFELYNGTVFWKLLDDVLDSSMAELALTLDKNMKVMMVHGATDFICSYVGGEAVADNIKWHGQEQYLNAQYEDVHFQGENVGKRKQYKNLSFIIIHHAGHAIFYRKRAYGLELLRELMYYP